MIKWLCMFCQSLAAHSRDAARADVAGGPPPFIPFAQRGKVENASKRGVSYVFTGLLSLSVCDNYYCHTAASAAKQFLLDVCTVDGTEIC